MSHWLERAFGIRGHERALVLAFFGFFAGIGMFYTIGATVGDTLLLSNLTPEEVPTLLPWVYGGIALASLAATLLYDAIQSRVSRVTLIVGAQLLLALSVLAFRLLIELDNHSVYFALVIWMEVCALLSITLFFSFAGDYFSPRDARRLYGFIVGGMALGTVVAGNSISALVRIVDTRNLLYACAGLLLVNALACWRIHRFATPLPAEVEAGSSADKKLSLWAIFQRPYVRMIALAAALALVISVMVDYQMKWVASTKSEEELARFFGTFWGAIGVAQLLFQFVLVPRLLGRLGIINCLMIQPLLICLASVALLVAAQFGYFGCGLLAFSAVANFLRITLSETLDLPSREILFLPLPTRIRVRAQPFMNGGLAAGARGLGGLLLLLLIGAGVAVENLSVAAAVGCLLLIIALLRLRPSYRKTLAAALRAAEMDSADLQEIVGSRTAKPVIEELLRSPDPGVVQFTLRLLEGRPIDELADRFEELLTEAEPAVTVGALRCIDAEAPDELKLLTHLHTVSPDPEVRETAVLAVCRASGGQAPDDIYELLESGDRVGRSAAMVGLARYADEAARCVVRSMLEEHTSHEDDSVRIDAARAIGAIGHSDVQLMLERLLADRDLGVRQAGIQAAAATKVTGVIPELIDALSVPELRTAAADALGEMPSDGVPLLADPLTDPYYPVDDRRLLIDALGRIGGPGSVRALWHQARGEGHELILRNGAADALRAIHRHRGLAGNELDGFDELLANLQTRIELLNTARDEVGATDRFAAQLFGDHARLTIELLLNLLALRHDAAQIDSIQFNLFANAAPLRARALELLDELLPRRDANRIVPLLQPHVERRSLAGGGLTRATVEQLVETSAWLRAGTAFHLSSTEELELLPLVPLGESEMELLERMPTVAFLRDTELFATTPADCLLEPSGYAAWIEIETGDPIFEPGYGGDVLYLVAEGELVVGIDGRKIAPIGPGECLGELALLIDSPGSASVEATAPSKVLCLPGRIVRQLLLSSPAITRAMMGVIDRRIRQIQETQSGCGKETESEPRLSHISLAPAVDLTEIIPTISFLRRVELFAELPISTITRLAGIVEGVEYLAGEDLFRQGDPGDALYMIHSGEVEIIINDRTVATMGQNACLGEMALISGSNRSATVRIIEHAKLLRLASEDFEQLLATEPDVSRALMRTLALRLRQVSRAEIAPPV